MVARMFKYMLRALPHPARTAATHSLRGLSSIAVLHHRCPTSLTVSLPSMIRATSFRKTGTACLARHSGEISEKVLQSVATVFTLFEKQGDGDYVGEPISQAEHGLQAADLARRAGFDDEEILAALLHDIGHMVGLEVGDEAARMGHCGVMHHEVLGGRWLRNLGFSQKVADLVTRHVVAKRYLCCVQPGYYDKLSDASKTTLGHQGGPMTREEAQVFEKDDLFKTIIAMRHWDEGAKVKGRVVAGLESYRPMMEKHLVVHKSI